MTNNDQNVNTSTSWEHFDWQLSFWGGIFEFFLTTPQKKLGLPKSFGTTQKLAQLPTKKNPVSLVEISNCKG